MKCIHFIPPAISLILVGVWLLPQRRSMAALESECARLRSSIAVAEVPSTTTSDSLKIDRKSIDWARLGGQFQSNPELSSGTLTFGLIPDQRDAMRANQCMEAMSIAEIITTLEEIAALELSPKIRENLEWTLLDCMARKDPAAALELLESRGMMKSSLYQHLISKTLMVWAYKDCGAAGDWFDKQIAAGAFRSKALDGVDSSRYSFETILIRNLMGSSPQEAARRLGALPEDQRSHVMSTGNFSMVLETNHAEYAALIRTQVPAKEQAETIASQMTNLIKHGDYSAATAYLDRIAATPAEREVSAMKSIQDMYPKNPNNGKLSREDFDGLREWVGTQAPASVDKVTVKALALAANGDHKIKFADAADLAVQYSAQNGSDEVLAGFLSSNAALRNKPIARDLAAKIADEARRAEVLHFLK